MNSQQTSLRELNRELTKTKARLEAEILERKKREKELEVSQNRLSQILMNYPNGIIAIFDQGYRIVFAEGDGLNEINMTKDDILGRSFSEVFPKELVDKAMGYFKSVWKGSKVEFEVQFAGKTFLLVSSALYHHNGGIHQILVLAQDITELKKYESELKESENRYRTLFEQSGDPILLIENKTFIECNNVTVKFLGYSSKSEIAGKNPHELSPKFQFDGQLSSTKASMYMDEAFKNGSVRFEWLHQKKDGRNIWVDVALTKIDFGGRERLYTVWRDITESKKAELELRASEEKFRTFMDHLPSGIFIKNSHGGYEYINKFNENQFGVKDWRGKTAYDFFDKKIAKQFEEEDKKVLQKGSFQSTVKVKSIDDKDIYFTTLYFPIKKPDGTKLIGGISLDVTNEILAKKAVEESEERFKTVIENAPDAIAIHINGRIAYANPAAAKLLEIKDKNKLIGADISWIVHPDEWEATQNRVQGILKGNKNYNPIEEKYITFKGNVVPVEVTATRITFNNETAVQVFIRDITERKKAELQILDERNKAENYLETAAVMMLALNKKGEVTMINSKGAEILGYSKKYIIGKNWIENFIPEESRKKVRSTFKMAMTGKIEIAQYVENDVKCRYNKIKTLSWHNNVLKNSKGKIIGGLSSAEDITEKIKLQKKLEESHTELERLTAHLQKIREDERSNLARELHDDLGQSLTGLKIDLTQALKKLDSDNKLVNKKIKSALGLAGNTIKTVQRITSDLRPGMIDDLGLLPAIRWYVDEFMERSNIKVKLNFKVDEANIKKENKIAVYRIVQETLTNVVRHAKASKVLIRFQRRKDNLFLQIEDDGIGIEEEQIHKPKSFGMIGMKERVILAGGKFEASGEKSKGTKIKVTLPIR